MKNILFLILLCGCVTVSDPAADRVSRIAEAAATIGTRLYVAKHPDARPAFQAVGLALTALVDSGNYDPSALATALHGLPVDALTGPMGDIYVSVAIVIWDEAAHSATGLNNKPLVSKTMLAIRNGIALGLR